MRQLEALEILKTGANVFLTGEPGAGKTYTINSYIKWLREHGVEPSVTASTGIAATHVNGMTIHSWSGIGVRRDLTEWDLDTIMTNEKTVRRISGAKVLIIDEISMLDATTLAMVDRVLRNIRRASFMQEKPFGGLQVIFVGDFFQLPPISRDGAAQFAFESDAWATANPIVCYLSEQHRQEDEEFLEVLSALRRGELEEAHKVRLRARVGAKPTKGTPTRLHTHNVDVDRINTESLGGIKGATRSFEMTSKGSAGLVESLKRSCLSPEHLELKEGAAVMFTRNNFDAGYVNGTLGTIAGWSASGVPIVKTFDGRRITAEPAEWSMQDGSKVLARIEQIPLRLAWAITVHKSQGMSLDSAIVDLSRAFEYGQGYVAISRVRTLAGLYLEGLNSRSLQLHPRIIEQDFAFRSASDAARRTFAALPKEELKILQNNFLRAIGGTESGERRVEKRGAQSKEDMSEMRGKYPNMGKSWSTKDDSLLKEMFGDKKAMKDMATHFGRKSSAIRARLGHFGLVKDFWASKKAKAKKA